MKGKDIKGKEIGRPLVFEGLRQEGKNKRESDEKDTEESIKKGIARDLLKKCCAGELLVKHSGPYLPINEKVLRVV